MILAIVSPLQACKIQGCAFSREEAACLTVYRSRKQDTVVQIQRAVKTTTPVAFMWANEGLASLKPATGSKA